MAMRLDELAAYITVLSRAAHASTHAEDRSTYASHLAAAAEIFACLHGGRLREARDIVSSQRRAYGWGHLLGDD